MLNYVNSNLCSTIKRDEQRQEMGSLHQPGATKNRAPFHPTQSFLYTKNTNPSP
ncbi:hypothetical protein NC653_009646 [Populus alba x Populus x berolinensis]|uniref:Uncharacterized protein n=1 Tax=Populus alba x Populus x berolinensis TaxID=444605 RepID=A0AAD6RAT3_9ROSI|nr:hypothetical protein NC653_009646 [Populus alba x Populus x berolinensis]